MWMASHAASGGLVWDGLGNNSRWTRLPLFVAACFIFHWLLDTTPVYHDLGFPWSWWQPLVVLYQVSLFGIFLWQFDRPHPWGKWLLKVVSKRLGIGLFAWLCVDIWWLYRPWGMAMHSVFPNIGRWAEPQSCALELAFMGLCTVVALKQIGRRRKAGR